MYFGHRPIVTSDGDSGSLGHVGHEPVVLELKDLFAHWDYLKLTDGLGIGEVLIEKSSKTGLIELSAEDGELATHEYLIHPVTPEKVDGRQLDGETVVVGRDGEDVVLYLWDQEMVGEEG